MADNFYDYLYQTNPKSKVSQTSANPVVVEDEAIGTPWTHKFTVYCSNPSKSFQEELKAKDGVVAVYMKEKEMATSSDKEADPSNK